MMWSRTLIVGAVAFLGFAGAAAAQSTGSTPAHAGHEGMAGMQMNHGWMAMLAAPSRAKQPAGMAMIHGNAVQLTLAGDQPGSARPWHVHKGTCANDEGVVGEASAYAPLKIGSDGRGGAKATLGEALPATGSYFVAVHASPSDMKTVVACGALKQGGM